MSMPEKPVSPALARLLAAQGRDDLVLALARERHVATPAGAKKFGKPIKALITPSMVEKAKGALHAVSRATQAVRGGRSNSPAVRTAEPGKRAAAQATASTPTQPTQKAPSGAQSPLDDVAYQTHFDSALATYKKALKAKLSTDETEKDAQGDWKPERKKQQKALMDEMYAQADSVPSDGKAILSGGLGGSGKGTVLGAHIGIEPGSYFTIDADLVKTAMIDRGMTPKIEGLSEGEAAGLIHHESSEMAKELMRRAIHDKKNVILDVTMAEEGGGTVAIAERLDLLKENGYSSIDAVFVDVPVEVAQARAQARHRKGLEAARNGEGHGGRMVPPDVIAANAPPKDEPDFPYNSRNRRVFESYKDRYTNWEVWDNSGLPSETKRVDSKSDTSISGKPIDKTTSEKLVSGVSGTAKEQVAAKQKEGEQ